MEICRFRFTAVGSLFSSAIKSRSLCLGVTNVELSVNFCGIWRFGNWVVLFDCDYGFSACCYNTCGFRARILIFRRNRTGRQVSSW